MSFDRKFWEKKIKDPTLAIFPCPSCHGSIRLAGKEPPNKESALSKKCSNHPDWEPGWNHGSFAGFLRCNDPECGEAVAVIGKYQVIEDSDEYGSPEMQTAFIPTFFQPPLKMFAIPAQCPKEVAEPIVSSFASIWNDPSASANKVRVAVEVLMDHFRMRKRSKSGGSGPSLINLHNRILQFRVRHPDEGDALLALKWLGNSGSHDNDLSVDSILDAYEILSHALEELFENRSKKRLKLIQRINLRKGPVIKRVR
jgi:hypothetical protein